MNKDLTVGKPGPALWRFCLPLFGSMIFQQLYNIADSWVAGRFIDENALAAVGISYEITLVFIAFAFGCNMGCSVISALYFGSGNNAKVRTTVTTASIATGALCLTLAGAGLLLSAPLLRLINTPAAVFDDSLLYLRVYILSLPFVFFYNLSTGIFSALGDSVTPFIFLASSSVANIGLDILCVKIFSMGVAGIAGATFICQSIACILAAAAVIRRLKDLKVTSRPKIWDRHIFRKIIAIAVPTTIQQTFISVGNIVIQGMINGFGESAVAGYSAAIKLNNLVITAFTTLANGVSNFTSQNIGAGKYHRIREGYRSSLLMMIILSVPFVVLYLVFREPLLRFFIEDPTPGSVNAGTFFLITTVPFYPVASVKIVSDGILRGARYMNRFMAATFTDLILRVVLAAVLSSTSLGYLGIWYAWPVGWVAGTVLSFILCRKALNYGKT